MILADIIDRNARHLADKVAIVDDKGRFTFAETAARSMRLADALAERGARPKDRIAVLTPNCHEVVEAFGAGEMAGYISVPLNCRLTGAELAQILADCAPVALIFDVAYQAIVDGLRATLASVRSFICIGGSPVWAEEYESVIACARATVPFPPPAPDDTAFILYTSGTTGRPKGVMHSHRGQMFAALSMVIDGNLTEEDSILLPNPLYMAGGKWMAMTYHLRGCSVFLQRQFEPDLLMRWVERERATAVLLPATMLRAVLDHPNFGRYDLSSLRTIYYAASPTPSELLERAIGIFGPIFVQYYGGTEGGGVGSVMQKHHHVLHGDERQQRLLRSAGQAKLLSKVRVVKDDGSDCAVGEAGEIILSSPGAMQGYWNNPQATAEALRDGWVHTGDIGTLDEEQFIYIVGRKKEMIVSGGANVYPREVEEALQTHPAVAEAAVIGIPDANWGETVHAVVARRPGRSVSDQELIAHCRSLVASYKKPTSIAFLDSLPKLDSGKIDKQALSAPFWAGRTRRVN